MLKHPVNRRWNRLVAVLVLLVVAALARPLSSAADSTSTTWSPAEPIATGLPQATPPSIVYTSDAVAHAIWESNNALYYASQVPNGHWSEATRVASGISPSMVVDSQGILNVLFANQFLGNYEIYFVRRVGSTWSLPINVSHTSGSSVNPTLTLASDGTLHAAWNDSTPGYWTIYHGAWNGQYWSSVPVPSARGQAPSIAASPAGQIFLAWQDEVPTGPNNDNQYDVLLTELLDGQWSLPLNVSASPTAQSLGISVTATQDGMAQTTWVDDAKVIRYCYGHDSFWSEPMVVWDSSTPAHAPRIVADPSGILTIAWDELGTIWTTRDRAMTIQWPKPDLVAAPYTSVRGISIALLPSNGVLIGWVQADQPGDFRLYAARQAISLEQRIWLPMLIQ